MRTSSGTFTLLNDGDDDLCLYLEPEGGQFVLPPGKQLLVRIYGDHAMEMQQSVVNGKISISMWLDNEGFELIYEGKDVWDWVIKGGQRPSEF